MRASIAYFAGAGTVVAAIAAGLSGGLVIANILSPQPPKHEMTRLEQRMSPQPKQVSPEPISALNQADQRALQAPVSYLAASLAASGVTTLAAAAPAQPQPQTQANNSPLAAPANATNDSPARPAQGVSEQASAPDNAYAKARASDLKRLDDRRRADRHQQWAARRIPPRDDDQRDADDQGWDRRAQPREQDQRDADARGWNSGSSREIIVRRDDQDGPDRPTNFGHPVRFGFPGFNLFGPED